MSGGHRSQDCSPHNATIHPVIYFPANCMTSANFLWYSCLIIKTSFNWARSPDSTAAKQAAAILVFIAVHAIWCPDSLLPGTLCLTQHASCLSSRWTLAILKSIWVRLTPQAHGWTDAKKMDPNKMLTGGLKFFPRGEITNYWYPKRVWIKRKNQREKCHHSKTYSWQVHII